MIVANALYDVVFKYLMEDRKIAKLLLSALLQTEVTDLELKPQEYATDIKEKVLTVYRIDFKARIKLKDGKEQLVLIELQKAKFATDIMRFRRYLGKQYSNPDNSVEVNGIQKPLPIITIYFLGYSIKELKDIPVVRIARRYLEFETGKELNVKAEFVESLTHDTVIVQVEAIKRRQRKTEIEKVLSVFEPGQKHEISINENDYPDKYKPVIRKLLKAMQDEKVRETMEIEDEILEELKLKERIAEKALLIADAEKKQKEKALKLAERERREKEIALEREQKARQKEKDARQKEKDAKQKEQETKIKLAKKMLMYGEPIEDIMSETGLTKSEIEKLKPE